MRPLSPVAPRVRRSLASLASLAGRLGPDGVRFYRFGSAAPHWPLAPAGADLDIGSELPAASPEIQLGLRHEILKGIEALPTVRPVDLVDFATVTPDFLRHSGARLLPLPDDYA